MNRRRRCRNTFALAAHEVLAMPFEQLRRYARV